MTINRARSTWASLSALRGAFRSAPEPTRGPPGGRASGGVRRPAVAAHGRPGDDAPGADARVVRQALRPAPTTRSQRLVGVNLLRSGGQIIDSIPMTAAVGSSRLDGRQALIISYPADAPFPWARVT